LIEATITSLAQGALIQPKAARLPGRTNQPQWDAFLMLALIDTLRQIHGDSLGRLGLGPTECRYRIVATGVHWRLRAYVDTSAGTPLLIVAAPIKRPYIWDLADSVSVVRHCLRKRLQLYLLEWMAPSPSDKDAGLADYATRSIGEAVAIVARQAGGKTPLVMGHSLGGTLGAIFAAFDPPSIRGLVLLSTSLYFAPGTFRFRDAIVAMAPPTVTSVEIVPGSLLSQLSLMASPETFLWSRLVDFVLSVGDREALMVQARVERWALDEFPLPGRLVHEILEWLYRENRLYAQTLHIGNRILGPSSLRVPVLAVVNTADEVTPPQSIAPFIDAMPGGDTRLIEYPGEAGVGLQHLAILVGRKAHATVWPDIISWLHGHA
jgi:polyhydroxyalkanoate synthase